MKMLFVFITLLATPAFASDGSQSTDSQAGDFFNQPRLPARPDHGPFENPDVDYKKKAMEWFTKGGAGRAVLFTCAANQSRSPYSFNARCGLGYTAMPVYVRSKDVRYCYVGISCVVSDSSSNN